MTTTVELGQIGAPPPPRPPDVRNRLFHLPSAEAIVMPEMRQAGGWRCAVVAARTPWRLTHRPGHLDLTDDEIASLPTSFSLDPDTDPDGYAMVWVARIHQHDPCGLLPHLARRLNDDLRVPGSLTADFAPAAVNWLRRGAHPVMMRALKLQIDRLIAAGFLVRDDLAGTTGGLGAYTLTLPESVPVGVQVDATNDELAAEFGPRTRRPDRAPMGQPQAGA